MFQGLRKLIKPVVLRSRIATKLAFLPARFLLANRYFAPRYRKIFRWLIESNERTNFTYAMTPRSEAYIAHALALALGSAPETLLAYMQEPKADHALRRHVLSHTAGSARGYEADMRVEFGRRLGWYAVVRHKKPAVVIETGVDKGLGAVLLCSALMRNAADGRLGTYCGTDLDPAAGYLLTGPYREFGQVFYGDSIETLRTRSSSIDVFINDSDHSSTYEYDEYCTIADKLSADAVILGDNAHVSDSLLKFCNETGRKFIFAPEEPAGHWYPGGGIGIAF
jgi:predicted O-methyltransferase YrrM